MTTPAETIAKAIRDGFHELAEAVNRTDSSTSPETGPGRDDSPAPVRVDPEPPEGPQGAVERAARVLAATAPYLSIDPEDWMEEARALADAGLLADSGPMTVGQLGAQHIGKRVVVASGLEWEHEVLADRIQITKGKVTVDDGRGFSITGDPDTPCTVENHD